MKRIIGTLAALALPLLLGGCPGAWNDVATAAINQAIEGGRTAKDNEAKILTQATKAIGGGALNRMEPGGIKCGAWLIMGGLPSDSPCAGAFGAPSPVDDMARLMLVMSTLQNGGDVEPLLRLLRPEPPPPAGGRFDPDAAPVGDPTELLP